MCFSAPRCAQPGPRGSLLGGRRRARRPPPAPGAPGSPLNGGRRAPGGGRPTTTMPREAVLLLAWLALLLALPAPLLAFPSATPDVTASYPKDTTTEVTGEVTISESRGRRSEYSEPSSISTEQYVRNRTQEFIYVKENAGGRDQP
ncbi:penicillin-binding protein 1A-like isoform X2 [Anser cygnoides]|uniref:penicillin-binding protein 1A-like isoform X2 n=1 Tax=Anser cygnoides TaxID=8845 RepID=UPI0034D1A7FB